MLKVIQVQAGNFPEYFAKLLKFFRRDELRECFPFGKADKGGIHSDGSLSEVKLEGQDITFGNPPISLFQKGKGPLVLYVHGAEQVGRAVRIAVPDLP